MRVLKLGDTFQELSREFIVRIKVKSKDGLGDIFWQKVLGFKPRTGRIEPAEMSNFILLESVT